MRINLWSYGNFQLFTVIDDNSQCKLILHDFKFFSDENIGNFIIEYKNKN